MIPPTKNGLPALVCLSAMQKCIRRGMELEAMQFAVELIHTSRAGQTMVANRLEIISHEDIDTAAAPHVVPFVRACAEKARDLWDPDKLDNPGGVRMVVGNAIRMMCRAPKSREGDHFQASTGLAALLEGFKPEIPEWAYDKHTPKGKGMGRGIDHFLADGCKLETQSTVDPTGTALGSVINGPCAAPVEESDRYASEAFRLWRLKEQTANDAKPGRGKKRGQLGLPGAE